MEDWWEEHGVRESLLISYPILEFFSYRHLPPKLAEVSQQFCSLAFTVAQDITATNEQEKFFCLRKILEAKDCAVRAILPKS